MSVRLGACSFKPPRKDRKLAWLIAIAFGLGACLPASPLDLHPAQGSRPTPTADVAAFIIYPQTPLAPPAPTPEINSALAETLAEYAAFAAETDSAQVAALVTLRNFIDAAGPYRGAWWFEPDGRGDIYEILAVIFYTEGNTSLAVRQAIAARYLWYCGGAGEQCQGSALINFLAYFQAWREPWMVKAGLANPQAKSYLALADDLVHQRGIVAEWIPGAEWCKHDPNGLAVAGPIDWELAPFHFANVHATWDAYLRQALNRSPNGPNRLWVLTVAEASQVCANQFVCPDMTQARP